MPSARLHGSTAITALAAAGYLLIAGNHPVRIRLTRNDQRCHHSREVGSIAPLSR